jgi:hypothetical protein
MRRSLVLIPLLLALAVLAAACGGGGNGDRGPNLTLENGGITPIPGNSELVLGPNRFALALIDETNHPVLEAPGTSVRLRFVGPTGDEFEQNARFVWAIPDANGFWAADVDFPQAGQWQVEALLIRDSEETAVRPFSFPVREDSTTPGIGDTAPATENRTLATEPNIKRLSTDPEPEPALYELTVAQALEAGKPFLVIFATPKFCQTRFCGPVLDNVKAVRPQFADLVNFIHIEPFELDAEGELVQPPGGGVTAAQPTNEWQLQTEPWIFIIGADGKVAARFEGAASTEELTAALQAVLG